jgi:hypothetical protein
MTKEPKKKVQKEKIIRIDYQKFIEDNFMVIDHDTQTPVPFVLNTAQAKYCKMLVDNYDGRFDGVRDIILKARQQGFSSFILALFTVDFLLRPYSKSICISHRADSTTFLFKKVKFYLDCYIEKLAEKAGQSPEELKKEFFKSNSRNLIENNLNGSTFYVLTAGAKVGGRGDSARNVIFSEAAFYQDTEMVTAEEMIMATTQMVPQDRGMIFIESTANGEGNYYHKTWQKAAKGQSAFKPIFFGRSESYDEEWIAKKEKTFTNRKMFLQEFPNTPDEAFITSGTPFFDVDAVRFLEDTYKMNPLEMGRFSTGGYFEGSEFEEDAMVKIYREIEEDEQFVIFADPADGMDFCAAVACSKKHYDVPIVFNAKMESSQFGYDLYYMCNWIYNKTHIWPKLAVERNSGQATIHVLKELNYTDLFRMVDFTAKESGTYEKGAIGWTTTGYISGGELKGTRRKMLDDLAMAIRQRMIRFYDEEVFNQVKSFKIVRGKAQASRNKHDDLLISLAGAWQVQSLTPDYNFGWTEDEATRKARRSKWRFK